MCAGRTGDGLRNLQAHPTRSRLAAKGALILNPYYLRSSDVRNINCRANQGYKGGICGTGPPIPRRSCTLPRQLRFWTDRSHLVFVKSHGYFREVLVIMRRSHRTPLPVEPWQSYLILILLDCALCSPPPVYSSARPRGRSRDTNDACARWSSQSDIQAREPPPNGFPMSLGRAGSGERLCAEDTTAVIRYWPC